MFQLDAQFDAWLAALPDLDRQELEKATSEIAASRDLGQMPEERLKRLATARRVAAALTVVSSAVSVWAYYDPSPYAYVIAALAAMPLVASMLVAKSGRVYQIMGQLNDPRANLALVFITPGAMLAWRAVQDIQLFDWRPAAAAALLLALMLTTILAVADRALRGRRWELLGVLCLLALYAGGGVVEANALLDRSSVQCFKTIVLGKNESHGKSVTYYLRLAPWGPRREEGEVAVPQALYGATALDQPVCVFLHDGALHIPWFVLGACQ